MPQRAARSSFFMGPYSGKGGGRVYRIGSKGPRVGSTAVVCWRERAFFGPSGESEAECWGVGPGFRRGDGAWGEGFAATTEFKSETAWQASRSASGHPLCSRVGETMPARPHLASRSARKQHVTKAESLRTRIERLARKPRPSLVALIDSLPPGTRTKEEIDREFEELRGSAR
jgi:hypothetical protein